jgi:hypothetical protein
VSGKRGRPTRYEVALVAEICTRIAGGDSLRRICADATMPAKSTVLRWLFDGRHPRFVEMYARAREAQAEVFADEIVDIADAAATGENLQAVKLRVDARKWAAAKLLPKKYGDRVQHTGTGGGAIEFVTRVESSI